MRSGLSVSLIIRLCETFAWPQKEVRKSMGFDKALFLEMTAQRRYGRLILKTYATFTFTTAAGEIYEVPEGFETDLASVPRAFWWVAPPMGRYSQAAVLHDWLCWKRQMPSAKVHRVFYEAMLVLEVPRWKAWAMWKAVQAFGPQF